MRVVLLQVFIIAYLIWKGSYNIRPWLAAAITIIAYLIWKGSYNPQGAVGIPIGIIAYLIWKGSYNLFLFKIR